MDIFFIYLLKGLLLPPAGNLVLLGLAWCLRHRCRRVAYGLGLVGGLSLYLLGTPIGAALLAGGLENTAPFDLASDATPRIEAIVVPGSGRYTNAPEYNTDTVSLRSFERLRYAARLARATGWPIAVIGGSPFGDGIPEGILMQRALAEDFGVPVRWVEQTSRNTAENAEFARRLVKVNTILLVTQAMDMPRARRMFEQAGFDVVPAPVGFVLRPGSFVLGPLDFLPEGASLAISRNALHEYLGLLWYRLRY